MPFQVSPLDYASFAPLFDLDAAALAAHRARLVVAGAGAPCRVSLIDAVPGETVLLVNFVHQPADSAFHASHAIYVRRDASAARPAIDEIPPALAVRVLSLRGFDVSGDIVTAELVDGAAAAGTIAAMLDTAGVAYIHAHYARYGCYAARIDRA